MLQDPRREHGAPACQSHRTGSESAAPEPYRRQGVPSGARRPRKLSLR